MVHHGSTYWILTDPAASVEHLYVVISDPVKDPDNVVLVSFTTRQAGVDESCVIYEGEHPCVRHDTCVDYRRAHVLSALQIDEAVTSGKVRPGPQADAGLLDRILRGAQETRFLPDCCDAILDKQQLFD